MDLDRTPEVILVVCRANVARSPLAAALLQESLAVIGRSDIRVDSAGFDASPEERACEEVIKVGRSRGLDLSGHRSRPVAATAVAEAALILTMTEAERARVARLAPQAITRTFTLPELARLLKTGEQLSSTVAELALRAHRARPLTAPADGAEDVEDPLGRPLRHYQGLADRLTHMLRLLTDHLTEEPSRSQG